MSKFRRITGWVHLYSGLAAAPLLLVLGLTGSFLVFEYPLDHLFHAHLAYVQPAPAAVPLDALLTPAALRSAVDQLNPEPAEDRLRRSLDQAVANGSLLRVTVRNEGRAVLHFLPATKRNREMLDRLRRDDEEPLRELDLLPAEEVVIFRPNIFAYYEQHIGPLTPLLAEQLRDAERSYPRGWIEEAIRTAAGYNKRNWRYIQAILSRWEASGGPEDIARKSSTSGHG